MHEYTHNGHFKWGFNGVWGSPPSKEAGPQSYAVKFGVSSGRKPNFGKACLSAAQLIRDKTDLPINVALSGGYDSEVTLRSFVDSGIPVTAYVARFKDDVNVEEFETACSVADRYGVPLKILDLDVIKFWEENWRDYADRYHVISGQFMVHIWIMSQLDGFPVIGGGDPYLVLTNPDDYQAADEDKRWYCRFLSRQLSTTHYLTSVDRPGVPLFYYYTPELILSSFANNHVESFIRYWGDIYAKYITNSRIKKLVYGDDFPTHIDRPKRTGFEDIEIEDMAIRKKLRTISENRNPQAIYPREDFVAALRGEREYPIDWAAHSYTKRLFP
jgi:hypothetical protein